MSFRVRMSCRDCTGEDPMGCFDGGTELLGDDAPELFATLRDAVQAGRELHFQGPMEWDVEYADGPHEGEEIDCHRMTEAEIDAFGVQP